MDSKNDIIIHYCDHFGIHAGEQRNDSNVVLSMLNYIEQTFDLTNKMMIFESQRLCELFLNTYKEHKDVIFYNPVSKVSNKTRIFLEGYDEINDYCDFNGQNWKKSFIISTYVLGGVVVLLGVLVVILCIKKRSRIEPMIDNVSPLTEGIANV